MKNRCQRIGIATAAIVLMTIACFGPLFSARKTKFVQPTTPIASGDVGAAVDAAEEGRDGSGPQPMIDSGKAPNIPAINLEEYANELDSIAYYDIVGCADGTFLIGFNFTNGPEHTYFNYTPPVTERGTPVLFTRLYWSHDFEVSVHDGVTRLSIPMRANELEDYRFRFEADIVDDAERKLQNRTIALLRPADILTNAKAQRIEKDTPIPVGENTKYFGLYTYDVWPPEAGTENESELAALRTAVYGGDSSALLRLYALGITGNDVGADINALQLAAVKLSEDKDILAGTAQNPLLKPIIYDKTVKDFPAEEALQPEAEAVRTYQEYAFFETNSVAGNIDESRLKNISNYSDFFQGYDGYNDCWGAWELDFDGDGLMELIYFYAGGTMGNEFWNIVHLNQNGLITNVDNGMDMRSLTMQTTNGQYYFTNHPYDYNDHQSEGTNLFAMEKDGLLWQGRAYREVTGMRTVLTDLYDAHMKPLYDTLSSQLFAYYQQYKEYNMGGAFDRHYMPDAQTEELFRSEGYGDGPYSCGLMDLDNDGMDEIVGEWMFYPSSAHLVYGYDLRALEHGAKHTVRLNTLLVGQDELLCAFPVSYDHKNYFLTMQFFGDSQYLFKLQEIADGKPYMLAAWLATAEDQVHVTAGEFEPWW